MKLSRLVAIISTIIALGYSTISYGFGIDVGISLSAEDVKNSINCEIKGKTVLAKSEKDCTDMGGKIGPAYQESSQSSK